MYETVAEPHQGVPGQKYPALIAAMAVKSNTNIIMVVASGPYLK